MNEKKIHTNVLLKFEPTGKKSEAKIPFSGIYDKNIIKRYKHQKHHEFGLKWGIFGEKRLEKIEKDNKNRRKRKKAAKNWGIIKSHRKDPCEYAEIT